jgi:hypothetical protein
MKLDGRVGGAVSLLIVGAVLFAVPSRYEGPLLLPISPGHGLSALDTVALLPLLAGILAIEWTLWSRRDRLYGFLRRSPGRGTFAIFAFGLGLGLLIASVLPLFWWWAVGAAVASAALLAAVFAVARTQDR